MLPDTTFRHPDAWPNDASSPSFISRRSSIDTPRTPASVFGKAANS